jgi:transcriptional regulator with XRE-family HTH domain
MKNRLQQIMEREGLNPSKFAESIGIKRSAMSHYMTGRNDPGVDVLRKIYEKFPYVNLDWLLNGNGEMMQENGAREQKLLETPSNRPRQLGIFSEPESTPATEIVSPPAAPVVQPQPVPPPEYRKETRVTATRNYSKQPSTEHIMMAQKGDSRSVSKIVLFYSDDTFETFIPEKTKKDKG